MRAFIEGISDSGCPVMINCNSIVSIIELQHNQKCRIDLLQGTNEHFIIMQESYESIRNTLANITMNNGSGVFKISDKYKKLLNE